jgi:hypothetical protein
LEHLIRGEAVFDDLFGENVPHSRIHRRFRGGRLTARRFTVTAATSGVIKVGMTIIVQPAETAR